MTNDLLHYFENNTKRLVYKWMHYFEIYDRYLSKYRGTDVHFLEIGVSHGGSLQMWKDYFGPKAKIYGVDVNPLCKQFEEDQITIFIGDQGNKKFLESLKQSMPRLDVILDDGGHAMDQQNNTFDVLYPHVAPNGIFMCEDTHTSYWKSYGGGLGKSRTFIEKTKHVVDDLHAWHFPDAAKREVSDITKSTYSVHYYDSIVVFEKRPMSKPVVRKVGQPTLPAESK